MATVSRKPRGIRNHNPGNIRGASYTWKGEVGRDNLGFVQFSTPVWGIRALYRILLTYRNKYGISNVYDIIHRWAPPSENDTMAYVNHAAKALGVDMHTPLSTDQYQALIKVIIKHENGQQPYSDGVINEGMAAA
jgi:hypothetical protein